MYRCVGRTEISHVAARRVSLSGVIHSTTAHTALAIGPPTCLIMLSSLALLRALAGIARVVCGRFVAAASVTPKSFPVQLVAAALPACSEVYDLPNKLITHD